MEIAHIGIATPSIEMIEMNEMNRLPLLARR